MIRARHPIAFYTDVVLFLFPAVLKGSQPRPPFHPAMLLICHVTGTYWMMPTLPPAWNSKLLVPDHLLPFLWGGLVAPGVQIAAELGSLPCSEITCTSNSAYVAAAQFPQRRRAGGPL